jgi:hypothetical protein
MLGAPQCIQYIDRQLIPEMVNIFWVFDNVQMMMTVNLAQADPSEMTNAVQLWVSPPESPCVTSDNVAPWPGLFALK